MTQMTILTYKYGIGIRSDSKHIVLLNTAVGLNRATL